MDVELRREEKILREILTSLEIDWESKRFHRFMSWAFGPMWGQVPYTEFPHRWNRLHGEALWVDPKMNVRRSLTLMVELWTQETKGRTYYV